MYPNSIEKENDVFSPRSNFLHRRFATTAEKNNLMSVLLFLDFPIIL